MSGKAEATVPSASTADCGLGDLPDELIAHIGLSAGYPVLARLGATCRRFRAVLNDHVVPVLERRFGMRFTLSSTCQGRLGLFARLCLALEQVDAIPVRVGNHYENRARSIYTDVDEKMIPADATETVLVSDGDGTIALASNAVSGWASQHMGLRVHGTFAWFSPMLSMGTMMRYFVPLDKQAAADANISRLMDERVRQEVTDIETCFRLGAVIPSGSLAAQVRPVLRRLQPGTYTLQYWREWPWWERVLESGFDIVFFPGDAAELRPQVMRGAKRQHRIAGPDRPPRQPGLQHYCGYGPDSLVCTQHRVDESVVAQYEARIRAGENPCALLLGRRNGFYHILDGHHKLVAYQRARRVPAALVLEAGLDALVPFPPEWLREYDPRHQSDHDADA